METHFLKNEVELSVEKYNQHTPKIREGFNSFFSKEKPYIEKKDVGEIFNKFYREFKSVLVKGKQPLSEADSLNGRVNNLRQKLEEYFVKPKSILNEDEFNQLFKKFEHEFDFHFSQSRAILSREEFNEHFSDFVDFEKEQVVTPEMMKEREFQQALENSLA